MASYYRLVQSSEREPILHLFDAINYAQHEREKEIRSATKIQSIAKMRQQRSAFLKVVGAVIAVQRVYKGYQARKKTVKHLIDRDKARQMKIFHYFATLIQSRFRGYISRKKGYDYYSQRRYVEGVVAKSEEVRKEALAALENQLADMASTAEKNKRVAFEKSLLNKHHLLSTATISGVYRPPLSETGFRTVFGTNVEDELRSEQTLAGSRKFKRDLPTTLVHANSTGASPCEGQAETAAANTSPTRSQSTKAANNKLITGSIWGKGSLAYQPPQTLLSSTPYDIVQQQERHDSSLNKAITERIHGKGFSVKKPEAPKFGTTVNCETPYRPPPPMNKSTR